VTHIHRFLFAVSIWFPESQSLVAHLTGIGFFSSTIFSQVSHSVAVLLSQVAAQDFHPAVALGSSVWTPFSVRFPTAGLCLQ
jgi:hypothetical protein